MLGRILAKVVAFNVEDLGKRHLAAAHRRVFRIVDGVQLFDEIIGVVVDHNLDRIDDGHDAGGAAIEILAQAMLQELELDDAVGF